jgi:5-(carboxyamino)imidazole ribonucleotide mutase
MPPGFPVGTLALDKVGAKNAAWLAAQIIALHDANLAERLRDAREKFKDAVEKAAANL